MSKAPKTKRTAIHYQPYQALSQTNDSEEQSIDTHMSDVPLDLDPVLTGLSSNMSRNLWDDWNEHDANFGMKFDMYTDEASTTSSTTSSNLNLHIDTSGTSLGYEQEQNVSLDTMTQHSHVLGEDATSTLETQQMPRADVERSLSEDIVKMLNDTNETIFSKQLDADQRSNVAMQSISFSPGQNMMGNQQHMQQQQLQMKMELQLQLQQQQQQQQYQQQEQQFQQNPAPNISSWMNSFGDGTQFNAITSTSASGKRSNPSAHRHQSHTTSSTAFDVAAGEGTASLTTQCLASRVPATPATSSSCVPTIAQEASKLNSASENFGLGRTHSGTPSPSSASSEDASVANKTINADTDSSNSSNARQASGFGAQGMMMNPFMMYPMMVPQAMNMMGMPLQIPMGMNVNAMNGMNGLPLPMQMQLQLQLQLQMAQMAQMNGMGSIHGMQMPVGLPGMSMSMSMQMPLNMNMQQQQQQQHRVDPQSGLSGDIEMTPAFSMGMPAAGGPILAKALQPKGVGGGPGFVNIARKPEEPEVSSILKSLMDEEAKKKEKKLERNRDSARESRRKQQTYVETLENGIKRLQINRDLIRSYRWGVSGPGFGSVPCPNSPEMSDWKSRVAVVTGRTEAFSNIQNPANFQSLMRLNRQRCTLAIHHQERERAVWKCFAFIGRQLAAMRTRVLQVQMLRTFSGNPLAMELDALLNLTADQKLQLQRHAQQMFSQEVVELTKLFKIFYALRNEALRLNVLCPSLERHFREACSSDHLHRLLQWTESHRAVIETDLCLNEV